MAACALAAGFAGAQAVDPASVAPDIVVTVREHQTTADIVEASARDPRYSAERLRAAALRLGERTGSPPRGLDVRLVPLAGPGGKKVARAYFATDHVIDRASGTIDLTGLTHAFCEPDGDPPVKNLAVILDGEVPVAEKTPKLFKDDKVWMRAAVSSDLPGIEVRISLQGDSLEGVAIPTDSGARTTDGPPPAVGGEQSSALLWGLVVVSAVAGAALVYSLLALRQHR